MNTAKIENVDKIECTLQFTMSIADWKRVKNTLNKHAAYAEMQLITDIGDLVRQLEKTLYPTVDFDADK